MRAAAQMQPNRNTKDKVPPAKGHQMISFTQWEESGEKAKLGAECELTVDGE